MDADYNVDADQKKITYCLTYKDVVYILEIIDQNEFVKLEVEAGDLRLNITKNEGITA